MQQAAKTTHGIFQYMNKVMQQCADSLSSWSTQAKNTQSLHMGRGATEDLVGATYGKNGAPVNKVIAASPTISFPLTITLVVRWVSLPSRFPLVGSDSLSRVADSLRTVASLSLECVHQFSDSQRSSLIVDHELGNSYDHCDASYNHSDSCYDHYDVQYDHYDASHDFYDASSDHFDAHYDHYDAFYE